MVLLLIFFSSVFAKLTVIEPQELKNKFTELETGVIPSSLANFGNPPYGSHIIGRLYAYKETNITGCIQLPPINFEHGSTITNYPILILDRGNCSFVVKVRNAQTIGASAVIIIDNNIEDPEKVMMIDDGTAGNIYIPSMLISKNNGQLLKNFTLSHQSLKIRVQMTFEMPNPDNRVEYEIWMSSENTELREFLSDFSQHGKKLIPNTQMTPHYVLWYSVERSKEGFITEHKDCLSGGRYCAPDPDLDNGPRTGREIVLENLRQICLYNYLTENKKLNLWWDYISKFKECTNNNFNTKCSESILTNIGIKNTLIQECIDNSVLGSDIKINDNSLLRQEREAMLARGIFFYPSLIINNQTFRGDLESVEVMTAICAGFKDQPNYCLEYFDSISDKNIDNDEGRFNPKTVALIILFSLIVFVVILFLYRKWLRRDMNQRMKIEITKAVSQYIALTENSVGNE
ncbi:hypothetical protein SteCoe_13875 [Stentor coeruleus]|uniref:Uncharacterized protein n=1 Tax=Stentor coeruleus TaxID=5963 RepID=A0A1R2C797_9CILI|nr:hypothetical protein SteCoe_13875 [Stentor coeruleus]